MDNSPIPGGLLVAIEGIDGAGKTTLAHALAERIRSFGNTVTVTKEPTNGPWGRKLRESATTGRLSVGEEIDLFRKDRSEHVMELIAPALARNEVVVLDRYYYSTAAYQGASGADPSAILEDNSSFAPTPHLTVLLDLSVQTGLGRIRARGDEPNRFETAEALARARDIFLNMNRPEVVIVDAARPASEVLALVWAHVALAAAERLRQAYGLTPRAGEALLEFSGTAT